MQILSTPSQLRPGFDVQYFVAPLAELVAWEHQAPKDLEIAWDAVPVGNGEWCVAGYKRRAREALSQSSNGEEQKP